MPWWLGGLRLTFGPLYWKYFDSYYKDKLLVKEWKKWTKADEQYYTYDFTDPDVLREFDK